MLLSKNNLSLCIDFFRFSISGVYTNHFFRNVWCVFVADRRPDTTSLS